LFVATLVAAGSLFVAGAGDHAFIGSAKCKMCHLKEYKSWAETKMANSFDTLKPGERAEQKEAAGLDPAKDYTTDETCLPCHTTGYGEEGGFVDMATSPKLLGVGCEMCHGAGGSYVHDDLMSLKNKNYKKADIVAAGMVGTITEAQCQQCHNSDSPFVGDDYVFDFESRKDEGTHEKFPLKYEH
jgi:hypothetical protein